MKISFAAAAMLAATTFIAPTFGQSVENINESKPLESKDKAAMIRLQTLLDRAGSSPGVIDGLMGKSTSAAIAAYEAMQGMNVDGEMDDEVWQAMSKDADATAQTYTITEDDAAMEPTPPTPEKYTEMAKMDKLGYHTHSEMLAEKFHMDEDLLKELNPDADFTKAGTEIIVTVPGKVLDVTIAKIEVLKSSGELRALNAEGKLVFAAPASVGSDETPSPSGSMKVRAVAANPTYSYDPKNFGDDAGTDEKLTIPAGANGPVGTMWIDLDKPTYGIHGTPYPADINRTASHGCVRLTNWDATRLAKMLTAGETTVTFIDG
ncbi:L,D-transpeptidase [Ahrensia sp. R2A130]|uniref:L,D-transpeptidase family protein n=1 Tax=Ahrensia sp. R2A130 TaxID=744979 RepID=UPI0001E0E0AB|nr:L,D-transpeptidase [Ahrensia sp. R2A130]EFL89335.1 ErfK/YbiS/YcfS/YnhG family protein [Ahrensia sp. R2A130]